MLSIRATLLRDTFEGGDWTNPDAPEWPPSCMRLFSTLVAVADPQDPEDDALLQTLEAMPPPDIYAPEAIPGGTYRSAFVPTNSVTAGGGSTTLPGRTNGERGWPRAIPRTPSVWYRWPEVDLRPDQAERLARLCRRVPYFGRSTSPAIIEVVSDVPDGLGRLAPQSAIPAARFSYGQTIRSPYAGALHDLREAHVRKYLRGEPGDPWEIGLPVDYGIERDAAIENVVDGPYRTMVVLALRGRILDGRHTARVTRYVRRAVMSWASEHLPALHGHHDGDVTQCAFLGLPFVGARYADGHLLGVAVAIPELPAAELRVIDRALRGPGNVLPPVTAGPLGELTFERLAPLDAALPRPWGRRPERWTRPSRTWVTALPAVLDRYLKHRDDVEAEVRRAVVRSGFPEPTTVGVSLRPLLPGALDLRPEDTVRRAEDRGFKPYRHVRLSFPERVRGPVVIGSMRHYGLGLCVPLDEESDA